MPNDLLGMSSAFHAAADRGTRVDNNNDNTVAIDNAILDAYLRGSAYVVIPGVDQTINRGILYISSTVVLKSGVHLILPPGLLIRPKPGFSGAMFSLSNTTNAGILGPGVIDCNGIATYGVEISEGAQNVLDGPQIKNARDHGVYVVNSNDNRFVSLDARNNSQSSAGTYFGIAFDGTSSHNVATACRGTDDQQTPTQGYGWGEVAAMTGNYNTFAACSFEGNKTGNVTTVGANSGSTTTGTFSGVTLVGPTITGAPSTTAGLLGIDGSKHLTIGDGTADHEIADVDSSQTFTNKAHASPSISGTVTGGATYDAPVLDTPAMNGPSLNVTSVSSATYALLATDTVVAIDGTFTAVTVNLPAATGSGRVVTFIRKDSTPGTPCGVAVNAGDHINGTLTSLTFTQQYASFRLVDYASGHWIVVGGTGGVQDSPILDTPKVTGPLNSASTVGASAARPLNPVLASTPYPATSFSALAYNAASLFTLSGLPAQAVMALLKVAFQCQSGTPSPNDELFIDLADETNAVFQMKLNFSQNTWFQYGHALVPVTPGASNQLYYGISGTSGCTYYVHFNLLGWWEPA